MTPAQLRLDGMPTVVALVALWLAWGTSFPAIRVMVTTLPPLLASGTVFCTAGVLLALTSSNALKGLTRRQLTHAAGAGCCLLGAQGMVAVAEQHVYAGVAALLAATVPLWVSILRAFSGTRPTSRGAGRLLVGFAGTAVVIVADSNGPRPSGWALVVLAAAMLWAAGTLWAGRTIMPSARAGAAVQLLAGGFAVLSAGVLAGEPGRFTTSGISLASATALAYLIAVDSLAGFALYAWLLRSAPVTLVSTYAYVVPVVAYLVAAVGLGEPFRPLALLGAAAIAAAVATELHAYARSPGMVDGKVDPARPGSCTG